MKRTIIWIIVGVLGLGLLFILPSLLTGGLWGGYGSGYGMMGGGPGGMMGGYGGGSSSSPFGWIGMLVGLIVPLGILALIVAGGVWLVRSLGTPGGPSLTASAKTCPHCGRGVQADWKACPHCGNAL